MRALAIKQHPFCTVTEEAESPERLISSISAKMTGIMDVNEHNGRRPKFFPEIIRRLSRFLTPKSVKRKQRMPRNGSSYKQNQKTHSPCAFPTYSVPFSNAKVQVAAGYLAQDSRQKDGLSVHVMVVVRWYKSSCCQSHWFGTHLPTKYICWWKAAFVAERLLIVWLYRSSH